MWDAFIAFCKLNFGTAARMGAYQAFAFIEHIIHGEAKWRAETLEVKERSTTGD